MLETPVEIHMQLTREAEDRLALRLQSATSIGSGDAALRDHKFAIRRIDALTDDELSARAIEIDEESGPRP